MKLKNSSYSQLKLQATYRFKRLRKKRSLIQNQNRISLKSRTTRSCKIYPRVITLREMALMHLNTIERQQVLMKTSKDLSLPTMNAAREPPFTTNLLVELQKCQLIEERLGLKDRLDCITWQPAGPVFNKSILTLIKEKNRIQLVRNNS